ncbi:MAG TPA: SDR family NAD(P)-dependent oxidoreductase [Candidatus Acidoferrales bacterium]|jgi:NAD(P)-dependent dehydrogenase (short-subunit alcohol dehydrogenase family)|nr:SDR family NAD(P)-dependent oxidoreductase [Candidatus Acidoferrales bacterium]
MGFLSEGVAVITGAGSGMGRCLAQQLAGMGSSLALSDVDEKGLAETVGLLGSPRGKVTQHVVNVAEEARVKAFADEVAAQHGRATVLFNNAGVALLGNFEELSLEDIRWLMDINFWGVMHGVFYFMPLLKKERRAHIVNMSSVFGLVGAVGQSAYCASKFAVRGFTESLRHELEGTNIFVTSVHPGGIKTPIAKHARPGARAAANLYKDSVSRFERVAITTAEDAAARILKGVEKYEPRVLIGPDCRQVDILQRLRPAGYWKLLAKKIEDPGARK